MGKGQCSGYVVIGVSMCSIGHARLPQGLSFALHDHQVPRTSDMIENLGVSMWRANPLSTIVKLHLGHT